MPEPKHSLDTGGRSAYASLNTKPVDKDLQKPKKENHQLRLEPPSDERTDLIMRLIVRLKTS